jgi:hypothetical protein
MDFLLIIDDNNLSDTLNIDMIEESESIDSLTTTNSINTDFCIQDIMLSRTKPHLARILAVFDYWIGWC